MLCLAEGNDNCLWVTYDKTTGSCTMLHDCHDRMEECDDCSNFERACPMHYKKGDQLRVLSFVKLLRHMKLQRRQFFVQFGQSGMKTAQKWLLATNLLLASAIFPPPHLYFSTSPRGVISHCISVLPINQSNSARLMRPADLLDCKKWLQKSLSYMLLLLRVSLSDYQTPDCLGCGPLEQPYVL